MNANELADELDRMYELSNIGEFEIGANCIRQQQAEIEELKKFNKAILKKGGYPYPLLTDEEINVVAILQDAKTVPVGYEIWKTSEEFNKYKKIVLATARAILKKAIEK